MRPKAASFVDLTPSRLKSGRNVALAAERGSREAKQIMAQGSNMSAARPLSPHMQITMAASILNRAAGVALYGGFLLMAVVFGAALLGKADYDLVVGLLATIPGQALLFVITLALFYHLAAGLRHLAWDRGLGFTPATANATAALSFLFAFLAAVAVWGAILLGVL
jgi:succinate dehydrogenase / fumarate reductase, cytochrome b subunit